MVKRIGAKKKPIDVGNIWFSDEKTFTAAPRSQGARNDRVLIPSTMRKSDVGAEYIVRGVMQHGVSLMVGWRVSAQGKIQPYILPEKTFITEQVYINDMLATSYYPQIMNVAAGRPVISQQDRASSHFSGKSVEWLDRHMPGWIREWPGKGADMCPLDYGLWSQIQEKVWADGCKSKLDLRVSVLKHINECPKEAIDKAIWSFEKRVRLCLQEKGGYFEQKLEKKK